MRKRRSRGQSMVEYAIGIGAVTAVCMLVLGGLGFASQDVINQVLVNINAPNDQSFDVSQGSMGGIWTNGVSGTTNPPWTPQ
jgi:hypothetical protein